MDWNLDASAWSRGVAAAAQYRREHGNLFVPQQYVCSAGAFDGFRLGAWIANARGRKARLTAGQIAELDALGMSWDVVEDSWKCAYDAVKQFRAEHGDAAIPEDLTADLPSGKIKLAKWIENQGIQIRAGKTSQERIALLKAIGIEAGPARDDAWQMAFQAARAYREEHGNLSIGQKYRVDTPKKSGFLLGNWLQAQKRAHSLGKLSPQRIQALESLGIVWRKRT
jgi:hypothetical protein